MPGEPRYRRRYPVSESRPNASTRGYDSRWRAARRAFLREQPLCVRHMAQGIVESASVVDHITPHRGDYALFWDKTNWQSLCKRCHDHKTATEDGGLGRARRETSQVRQVDGPDVATAVRDVVG